ncbi:hypothetical protein PFFCH_05526 [Plasmodium falciparum FCH/4]|uniref:Plasmodium falciparum erythrocyte membrane protein 1 acidic terminal segment domain-containing protein n=1 Tax=Plasmodium falciparum FCH/4 TaxID=1036724 RepID=A0A024VFI1_PLAFA|nr:hypothetical protein PFFCH_05526 [Plasmodium falciparum FCH/4]
MKNFPLIILDQKNIPHNDITTKNNGFQTKNIRTYISTVIYMDEKNNVTCDDHLKYYEKYKENKNPIIDNENNYMNPKRYISRESINNKLKGITYSYI